MTTTTPPVKPDDVPHYITDDEFLMSSQAELRIARTRIAALEDCVRELRTEYEKSIHPGNGKAKQELITRSKNLVP